MNRGQILTVAGFLGGTVQKLPKNIMISCPNAPYTNLHKGEDKKPSFGIKIMDHGASVCNCYTCGLRGTAKWVFDYLYKKGAVKWEVVDFVRLAEKNDLKSIVASWEHRRENQKEEIHPAQRKFNVEHFVHVTKNRREYDPYFFSRGLTRFEIERYMLGYDPWRKRVTFPLVTGEGKIKGCSGRTVVNSVPKYYLYQSSDRTLFFGEQWRKRSLGEVTVVEGPVDAIIAARSLPNSIAAQGASLTDEKIERLIDFANVVNLLFDGNAPGRRGVSRVGRALCRRVRVFILPIPDGKDPATMSHDELVSAYKNRKIF